MTDHVRRQGSLLPELDGTTPPGPRRSEALRQVTDLFLMRAESYTAEQLSLFDEVMCRLETEIELSARIELANRLARRANAPPVIIRKLAFHDDIAVAGPVLTFSDALDLDSIVENAKTKSQRHLLAISRRAAVPEEVGDVIAQRGDPEVLRSALENPGARFSDGGYVTLMGRAEGHDDLIVQLGDDPRLPRHLFLKLLAHASEAVRARLEGQKEASREDVQFAVANAVARMRRRTENAARDYGEAQRLVQSARERAELTPQWVEQAASKGQFETVTAALAALCGLSIQTAEEAMAQDRPEPLLVLGRAAGLQWSAVRAILMMRAGTRGLPLDLQDQLFLSFERISANTARQFVSFKRRASSPPPSS